MIIAAVFLHVPGVRSKIWVAHLICTDQIGRPFEFTALSPAASRSID